MKRRTACLVSIAIASLLMVAASGCGSATEAPTSAQNPGISATAETERDAGNEGDAGNAGNAGTVATDDDEPGGGTTGNSDYATPVESVTPEYAQGKELLCLCDNAEEAQKIADLYGIELVEFQFGVATFHADDPKAVIALGKEKGYPELELNGVSTIFEN